MVSARVETPDRPNRRDRLLAWPGGLPNPAQLVGQLARRGRVETAVRQFDDRKPDLSKIGNAQFPMTVLVAMKLDPIKRDHIALQEIPEFARAPSACAWPNRRKRTGRLVSVMTQSS
jgi:hypothetical protein